MKKTIIICIFFIVLCSFLIQHIEKERTFERLHNERVFLEKTLATKQKELKHLERQFEKLNTKEAKEELAREKLNMIKKDEIRYILDIK